ncbi:SRR1-like protein [Hydra vulgaris]|nr:SRR1-like protein [Hydra vulgaris]
MDGFTLVKYKKHSKLKRYNKEAHSYANNDDLVDIDVCKQQIIDCKVELSDSLFLKQLVALLLHSLSCVSRCCTFNEEDFVKNKDFKDIVSYGIGSLANSKTARYQFSLLLLLKEKLEVNTYLFDPILSLKEQLLIEELGVDVIQENEECKRKVSENTIFLMLHCGESLYNNLLWSNWGPSLRHIFLIGNSFSSYYTRLTSEVIKKKAWYINEILSHCIEHPIINSFKYSDVFNDSAVHTFPQNLLSNVNTDLWTNNVEPVVINDIELISRKSIADET